MKRLFDTILAALGLLVLSPLLLITAVLIWRNLGTPVLFRQMRPGRDGQPFEMLKFRTMRDAYDADGKPLADAERMTPFGKKLRATSIDELPELWNVLKGEMSLVGPRPLLMEYLPIYSQRQARRHEVRPGLTGWAQVNGRNAITWDEKFEFDVWYVENRTFWLDLKIIAMTVNWIVKRDGISAVGEATAAKFRGSE
ncbi:MAG: sugar transferase [Litorimonas sp.]